MLPHLLMTAKGLLLLFAATYGFAALLRKEDAEWAKKKPLAILLSMFAIGMWGGNVWVAYIPLLLALPLLAKSRADAAALYCILTVAMPLLHTELRIGSLYLIGASKYLFCAVGLAIAFVLRKNGAPVLKRSRFDIPVLLVVVLELAQSRDPSATATIRQSLPILLTILLPYYVLSRSLNTAEEVRRFLVALSMAGFVMAAIATVEARLHWLIYKQIDGYLHIPMAINAYLKQRGGMIRAPASFPESTSLGIFLAIAFMALLATRSSFPSRGKWYAALGVVILGLISANSRGAFIAVGIGVLAHDYYCRRYGPLFTKIAAGGGLYLIVLMMAQFSTYFAAMVGKGSGTEATTQYRIMLLQRGMEEIRKHPMLGTNLKTALDNLSDLRQGEGIVDLVNGYISYGLTLGYAGMIGLAAVFISLCLAMLAARGKLRKNKVLIEPAASVFAVAVFSIVSSFYGGFGGELGTPFYQISAVGATLWAMRGMAAGADGISSASMRPSSPIQAMIEADRRTAWRRGADVSQPAMP